MRSRPARRLPELCVGQRWCGLEALDRPAESVSIECRMTEDPRSRRTTRTLHQCQICAAEHWPWAPSLTQGVSQTRALNYSASGDTKSYHRRIHPRRTKSGRVCRSTESSRDSLPVSVKPTKCESSCPRLV